MNGRLWSVRNKLNDVLSALKKEYLNWARMASLELAMRLEHLESAWAEIEQYVVTAGKPISAVDTTTSYPEILDGAPVFVGTKVPVAQLFDSLADGLTLDKFIETYSVHREQAIKALLVASKSF